MGDDGPDGRTGPHDGQPVETAGAPPAAATGAVVMLHGRGDSASRFLRLIDEFHRHGAMYLAPEAAGKAWFPGRFETPAADREPWFPSALALVDRTLELAADAGIPPERTVLVGFSQGAALAAEYAARNPRRYGGVAVLAGGLLGALDGGRAGSLDGTPVFLGSGADDPHVPAERVRASATVLRELDADVTDEIYDGLGHAINDGEIAAIDRLVKSVV